MTLISVILEQNERFDDWYPTILDLKKIFTHYKNTVLNYHEREIGQVDSNITLPKARISSAQQGNFLEVLNMTLNTFENQYLNRNMDRTGQQAIVLTPGMIEHVLT